MRSRTLFPVVLAVVAIGVLVAGIIAPRLPGGGASPAGAAGPAVLALGDAVTLADGSRVRFLEVVSDSRCPMDAICMQGQAGEAVVAFALEQAGGDAQRFTVILSDDGAASVGGYQGEVQELALYPMHRGRPQPTSTE
jgi:hypothetical protein